MLQTELDDFTSGTPEGKNCKKDQYNFVYNPTVTFRHWGDWFGYFNTSRDFNPV